MNEGVPDSKKEIKVMRQMLRSAHLLYQRLADIKNKSTETDTSKFENSMGDLKESISQLDTLLYLYECGNEFEDEFKNVTNVIKRHIQTARETLSQDFTFTTSSPLHFPAKPRGK